MAVSVNMTVIRASQINSVFRHKSSSAKYSTIRCLLQSNGIVIRSKTHEAQTALAEKNEVQLEMTMEPMEELDFEEDVNV